MSTFRARVGVALSAAVLVALALAWAWWPSGDGRADLRAVPAIPTTTTTTTTPSPTTVASPAATTTTTTTAPGGVDPVRLRIPSLGVDAAVVPVGLAPDRQMEIPPAADVGWYELGPRPGEVGSAVLAAHVDYDGRPGAFFDLAAIPVGAEVLIDGPTGARRFVVTTREQVAKADVRLERYFTADGPSRLTLITCGGAFSRSSGHYEDNLIITATPVG